MINIIKRLFLFKKRLPIFFFLFCFILKPYSALANTSYFLKLNTQVDSLKTVHLASKQIPQSDKKLIKNTIRFFLQTTYPLKRCDFLNRLAENLSEYSWQPYNNILYQYTCFLKESKRYTGVDLKLINGYYAGSINNLATIDHAKKNTSEALKKYYTSAMIYKNNKDYKNQYNVLNNAYILEIESFNYIKAYNCLTILQEINNKISNPENQIKLDLNLAHLYTIINLDSNANVIINKYTNSNIFDRTHENYNFPAYQIYLFTHFYLKKYSSLETELEQRIPHERGYNKYLLTMLLAHVYNDQEKYEESINILLNTLDQIKKDKFDPMLLRNQIQFTLSIVYQHIGKYSIANNYLEKVTLATINKNGFIFKKDSLNRYKGIKEKLNYELISYFSKRSLLRQSSNQKEFELYSQIKTQMAINSHIEKRLVTQQEKSEILLTEKASTKNTLKICILSLVLVSLSLIITFLVKNKKLNA